MGLIYGGGPYNEKIRPGPYIRSKSRFFETGVGLISDIRPGPYNRGNTVREKSYSSKSKNAIFGKIHDFNLLKFLKKR